MATFQWKILSITASNDVIDGGRYHAAVKEGDLVVETEGNWKFYESHQNVPFADVTEQMMIDWVRQETTVDGKCRIEQRLEEQLEALKKQKTFVAPWLPQVFTPDL